MGKAIILSRVSTDAQDLTQQSEAVMKEVKHDGYKESDIILIENKESAIKLSEEERIGLQKLKHYILTQDIDGVYVYEISRISRQAAMVFDVRDFLIAHKVQLTIIKPFFRMLDADGSVSQTSSIFFGIFSSLSESEMYIKKERMHRGTMKAKAMGRHAGGYILFGYKTNKQHEYMIDEEKADVVRSVFDMYINKKMSMRKIAKELQELGWFTHESFLSCVQQVNNMLHNRDYCGDKVGMPKIVEPWMVDKVPQQCRANQITTKSTPNDALLKGLIYDYNNGFLLSANIASEAYYSKRAHGCAVTFKVMDYVVWDWVKKFYSKSFYIDKGKISSELYAAKSNYEKKIDVATKKYIGLSEKIDKIEERLILGRISDKKAEELEDTINSERLILDDNIKSFKDSLSSTISKIASLESSDIDLGRLDDNLSNNEKRSTILKCITKITCYREKRNILIATIEDIYCC